MGTKIGRNLQRFRVFPPTFPQLYSADQDHGGDADAGARHQDVRRRRPEDPRARRPGTDVRAAECLPRRGFGPPARLTPFLCPLLVQLSSLEAAACPVLLDVLLQNQPEGVELSVSEVSRSTSWRGVAE